MQSIRRSWNEPTPCVRPAATVLEMPLRPSPRMRRARWCIGSMIGAYVLELVLEGHVVAAVLAAVLAVTGFWPRRPDTWRCLRVEPDGQLVLEAGCGTRTQVWLEPGGLRLGQHLLLALRADSRRYRLLLGPDNVAPGQLAALKRRLPG